MRLRFLCTIAKKKRKKKEKLLKLTSNGFVFEMKNKIENLVNANVA
jgi:hypothetical protein